MKKLIMDMGCNFDRAISLADKLIDIPEVESVEVIKGLEGRYRVEVRFDGSNRGIIYESSSPAYAQYIQSIRYERDGA